MLKHIQVILQNFMKESTKPKIKHNKTRTNSFVTSKRKTSIHPGILAPVGNKKHELENTQRALKIKKTYDLLMKKLISPNLDIKPQSSTLFEQIKNMDMKKQQELFSNLLPTKFFAKTKKKKFPGVSFDKKCNVEEKVHSNSTTNFAIGWSGQATSAGPYKPIIEIASKSSFDINSALFDYTDINELNIKKSDKNQIKKLKKISQRRRKPITYSTTKKTKPKKSVQLIKEIPKSHIGHFYRQNAERKERTLQQSVLKLSQGADIPDSPARSKILPVMTDVSFSNKSGGKGQFINHTKSNGAEKIGPSEEKEVTNLIVEDNWEEFSQHENLKQRSNSENSTGIDHGTDDMKYFSSKCMSPEKNSKEQNSDEALFEQFNEESAGLKHYQNNLHSNPEISHQVDSPTNEIVGSASTNYDNINVTKDVYLGKNKNSGCNKKSSINSSSHDNGPYLDDINTDTPHSVVGIDVHQVKKNTLPVNNNEGVNLVEENLNVTASKSMNTGPNIDKSEANHSLEQAFENIYVSNSLKKNVGDKNRPKKLSTSLHKKSNYLNQLYLKTPRSPSANEVVCNKAFTKEQVDSNISTSFSKISSKEKNSRNDKTEMIYKKQINKDVVVAEEKAYNNDKILRNFKESLILSKTRSENKSAELNDTSLFSTGLCLASKTMQKINNKSTDSITKKNKSFQIVSSKATRQKHEDLPRSTSKMYIEKGMRSKSAANKTSTYTRSVNKENKGFSKLKNEDGTFPIKTKPGKYYSNKPKVTNSKRLSSTTLGKFEKILKKPKTVVVVNSDYVKFIENKAWFLGNPSKIPLNSKSDINTFSEDKPGGNLKLTSFKVKDDYVQNEEKFLTNGIGASKGKTINNNKEPKEGHAIKEKLSHYNLEKCNKLNKRILKIKTRINDLKTNSKSSNVLKIVKPLGKMLESNVHKVTVKLEPKPTNSISSNFDKQATNKFNGKMVRNLNAAKSDLTGKTEIESSKTKPNVQLSKSLIVVRSPVFSKKNNSNDCLLRTNTKKDIAASYSIEGQSVIQNILNYNLSKSGLKKTRKLHSKKLGSKSSNLKMYGEGKNFSSTSDLPSLQSVLVVCKNNKNKTNGVSSINPIVGTRKCFARNFRNERIHAGNQILSNGVQNRNLCTVQDTASIVVNYLFKKFSTSTTKNVESNYFGLKTTNSSLKKGKIFVKADNVFNFNDNLANKQNVKRTMIRNRGNSIQPHPSEAVDTLKTKGQNRTMNNEKLFDNTPVTRRTPLTQKKDYSFEVLYDRNKARSKDLSIKNLQQDNSPNIKTSKQKLGTFNSNNLSHTFHNPYVESSKTNCTISHSTKTNTSSTQLKEGNNIVLPKQIMNNYSSTYKTIKTKVSKEKKLKKKNNGRFFEISNKDYLAIKPYQITRLTSYNKLNSLQKESRGNYTSDKKGNSSFHIREGFREKTDLRKPDNYINHPDPLKKTNSLPNWHHTYLEPTGSPVLKPLRWKSKSDRLKHFLFKNKIIRSEVRIVKKRTLIKPSTIQSNQLKSVSTLALSDNINGKGGNNKLELIANSNKHILISKIKDSPNVKVSSILQDETKQLHASTSIFKTKALEENATLSKQILNKNFTLISAKQKPALPLVSTTSLKKNSSIQEVSQMSHKYGISGQNLSTSKVELIKKPLNKPKVHENKTAFSSTLSDSSVPNKLETGKRSKRKWNNKLTVDNILNCHGKSSYKTNMPSSEIKNNKYTCVLQSVAENDQNNESVFKKYERSEKENLDIKLNEFKNLQKTSITKTLLDHSEPNYLPPSKRDETKRKNERTTDSVLTSERNSSYTKNNSEMKSNKSYILPVETVTKNNDKVLSVLKKDEKNHKEKPFLNELEKLQKTNNFKNVPNESGLDYCLTKMEEEPKMLAASFDLNFNLPLNIMAHNFKSYKRSPKENGSRKPEPSKESTAMQYYNQLQLLKTAKLNKEKTSIPEMEKQGDIPSTIPSKIDKTESIKAVSKVTKQEKTTSKKENEQPGSDIKSGSHKSFTSGPILLSKIVNTKSHLIKVKSPSSKQAHSKMVKPIVVTGTDKRPNVKPPKFPAGLLTKHLMEREKNLIADIKQEYKSNKLEKQKALNSSLTVKSNEVEPKKTLKQERIMDEDKENKSEVKEELVTITGSNITLNFDNLIKSKGRDKFYLSRTTGDKFSNEKANLKHENKESEHKGETLQVKNQAKSKVREGKFGNNKANVPSRCLEKIVDYGIQKSRSNLHKGLMESLKMLNSHKMLAENCKTKNLKCKPTLVHSSNIQAKTQDQLPVNPVSLVSHTNKTSISSEDIGKIENKIRSKNTFRVFKGGKTMKKRQLQHIDRNYQFGEDSFQNKREKEVQLKNRNKKTRKSFPKGPGDSFIYFSPVDPRSKGIYVLEIKPSKAKGASNINSSDVLKTGCTGSFSKKCIPYNIPNPKTKEEKRLSSR